MSDRLPDVDRQVREAVAQAMRDDDPDVSDEDIAAAQARVTVAAAWASHGVRVEGKRTTTIDDSGAAVGIRQSGVRSDACAASTSPSHQSRMQRIEEIVDKARELGPGTTRDAVALALGRADASSGEPNRSFKVDVASEGGWQAIRMKAGFG